jgi:hypothetical protein
MQSDVVESLPLRYAAVVAYSNAQISRDPTLSQGGVTMKRESIDNGNTTSRETARAKLPYQKPAFRYEGVFETMALVCGKISTTQQQCASLLKNS